MPKPLSPEFAELERRLERRAIGPIAPQLRDTILQAVALELNSQPTTKASSGWSWSYAAGLAAAAVLAINLSMSAALSTNFIGHPAINSNSAMLMPQALQQLAPDIPESEARRMMVLWAGTRQLVLMPVPKPGIIPPAYLMNDTFAEP
jgi:hypothetical protein